MHWTYKILTIADEFNYEGIIIIIISDGSVGDAESKNRQGFYLRTLSVGNIATL